MKLAMVCAGILAVFAAGAALAADPTLLQQQTDLGVKLYQQEKIAAARDVLAPVVAANPDDVRAARYHLFATFHSQALDDAKYKQLKDAAEAKDATLRAKYLFAEAAYVKQNLDDAWVTAHAIADKDAKNPYLLVLLSRLHQQIGDWEQAEIYAKRAYELAPDDAVVAQNLVVSPSDADKKEERIATLRTALQKNPESVELILSLRQLLTGEDQAQEKNELLDRAQLLAPESEKVRDTLTLDAQDKGQFEEWFRLLRAAADKKTDDGGRARASLAFAYAKAGYSSAALAEMEGVVKAQPQNRMLRYWIRSIATQARRAANRAPAPIEWSDPPANWPFAVDAGQVALVFLEIPGNDWTGRVERVLSSDREVAETAKGWPAYRVTAEKAPAAFKALAAGDPEKFVAPGLVALGPNGQVFGRYGREAEPADIVEGLKKALRSSQVLAKLGGQTGWAANLDAAKQTAKEAGALVVAYYPADDEWGRKMDQSLADPAVREAMSGMAPIKIEKDGNGAPAVSLRPAVLFLDGQGRVIYKALGYRKPEVLAHDAEKASARIDKKTIPESPDWLSDITFAFERARKLGRNVVMDVYTDWCGPCQAMETGAFADAAVRKTLDEVYVPLKLNPDIDKEVGKVFPTNAYPTHRIVNSTGMIVKVFVGGMNAQGYMTELDARSELNLLAKLGPDEYKKRQQQLQLADKLGDHEMHRAALAAGEPVFDPRNGALGWTLSQAYKALDRKDDAAKLDKAMFRAAEHPSSFAARQIAASAEAAHAAPPDADGIAAAPMADGQPSRETKKTEAAKLTPEQQAHKRYDPLLAEFKGQKAHEAAIWLAMAQDPASSEERKVGLDAARRALALQNDTNTRRAVASWLFTVGDLAGAEKVVRPQAKDADAEEIMLLAYVAQERKDAAGVEKWLKLAQEKDSDIAQQLAWQAEAWTNLSPRQRKAFRTGPVQICQLATAAAPDDPDVLNQCGYALAKAGLELDAAVTYLRDAISVLKPDQQDKRAAILDNLAWALHRQGKDIEALECMREAIALKGTVLALEEEETYHLGAVYAGLGMKTLAIEQLEPIAAKKAPEEEDHQPAADAKRLLDTLKPPAETKEKT